jgi:hypothetical protein
MFRVTEKPDSASIEYTQAPMASLMGVLQIFGALFFSSYFFFWALGLCGLIMSVQLNIISLRAACYLSAAYVTSIFVYKPQNTRGWYFHWFLYGPLTDLVLGYYGSRCIREGPPLDPKQGYLFAMAPHGVFGVCRAFSGGQLWRRLFPQIDARWGSFGGAFYIPGVREFSLCCGCLDASRPVLTRAIARGENVMLLPGGEKEMMLTDGASSQTQLVLLDRKGFVRLAIQHGLALVPGFCFGEKWVHETDVLCVEEDAVHPHPVGHGAQIGGEEQAGDENAVAAVGKGALDGVVDVCKGCFDLVEGHDDGFVEPTGLNRLQQGHGAQGLLLGILWNSSFFGLIFFCAFLNFLSRQKSIKFCKS